MTSLSIVSYQGKQAVKGSHLKVSSFLFLIYPKMSIGYWESMVGVILAA
jgi:hypothetical protein